jgi:hypothetical protein
MPLRARLRQGRRPDASLPGPAPPASAAGARTVSQRCPRPGPGGMRHRARQLTIARHRPQWHPVRCQKSPWPVSCSNDAPGRAAHGPRQAGRRQCRGGAGSRPPQRALMIYLDSAQSSSSLTPSRNRPRCAPGWMSEPRPAGSAQCSSRSNPSARSPGTRRRQPPACPRAGPDRPDRPGPAHPDAGPGGHPATVRSTLDAIHLATALRSRSPRPSFPVTRGGSGSTPRPRACGSSRSTSPTR